MAMAMESEDAAGNFFFILFNVVCTFNCRFQAHISVALDLCVLLVLYYPCWFLFTNKVLSYRIMPPPRRRGH